MRESADLVTDQQFTNTRKPAKSILMHVSRS
jgi:hypothetical protein